MGVAGDFREAFQGVSGTSHGVSWGGGVQGVSRPF